MKLNELSPRSQEKLKKAGFKLDKEINDIQEMGNALKGYYIYAPLHYAASVGDLSLMIELCKNKAAINQIDETCGFTPIMWAAEYGHASAVEYLLSKGATLQHKIKGTDNETKELIETDALSLAEKYQKPSGCCGTLYQFSQKRIFGYEVNYEKTIASLKSGRIENNNSNFLTDIEFSIFEKEFGDYLHSGRFPNGFKSSSSLNEYMLTHLSFEQRQVLRNKYEESIQGYNDFLFMWSCAKTVPRALVESAVLGIAAGTVISPKAGIGTGVCWLFARLKCNANKIRIQNDVCNIRYKLYDETLRPNLEHIIAKYQ